MNTIIFHSLAGLLMLLLVAPFANATIISLQCPAPNALSMENGNVVGSLLIQGPPQPEIPIKGQGNCLTNATFKGAHFFRDHFQCVYQIQCDGQHYSTAILDVVRGFEGPTLAYCYFPKGVNRGDCTANRAQCHLLCDVH